MKKNSGITKITFAVVFALLKHFLTEQISLRGVFSISPLGHFFLIGSQNV